MPYIKSGDSRRETLQRGEPALLAGELNYQIFYYIKHTINRQLKDIKKFVDQFLGYFISPRSHFLFCSVFNSSSSVGC